MISLPNPRFSGENNPNSCFKVFFFFLIGKHQFIKRYCCEEILCNTISYLFHLNKEYDYLCDTLNPINKYQ